MSDAGMGTYEEAKEALLNKVREWRKTRQPSMATASEHRAQDRREHQLRFELCNAAVLWLWHEEQLFLSRGNMREGTSEQIKTDQLQMVRHGSPAEGGR